MNPFRITQQICSDGECQYDQFDQQQETSSFEVTSLIIQCIGYMLNISIFVYNIIKQRYLNKKQKQLDDNILKITDLEKSIKQIKNMSKIQLYSTLDDQKNVITEQPFIEEQNQIRQVQSVMNK